MGFIPLIFPEASLSNGWNLKYLTSPDFAKEWASNFMV